MKTYCELTICIYLSYARCISALLWWRAITNMCIIKCISNDLEKWSYNNCILDWFECYLLYNCGYMVWDGKHGDVCWIVLCRKTDSKNSLKGNGIWRWRYAHNRTVKVMSWWNGRFWDVMNDSRGFDVMIATCLLTLLDK